MFIKAGTVPLFLLTTSSYSHNDYLNNVPSLVLVCPLVSDTRLPYQPPREVFCSPCRSQGHRGRVSCCGTATARGGSALPEARANLELEATA
ncbi:hypothetical protein B0H14DRAFT_2971311 [Mycena olivaceomarginata]|nr:hypothetical protein B0H14DRAFT_2971311 [Mycena olivaceomarginata]